MTPAEHRARAVADGHRRLAEIEARIPQASGVEQGTLTVAAEVIRSLLALEDPPPHS